MKKRACNCGCGSYGDCEEQRPGPHYPMQLDNGYLTRSRNRAAPSTDLDSTPREYMHPVDASGFKHVQANAGTQRRLRAGLRGPLNFVTYLYAAMPIIPGQTRDNYGGFHHPRGIDPQSYAQLWADGPGAQPVNPGGPGRIAADYFVNPGTC